MKATLKDIARRAKVSIAAVSMVLNDAPASRISKEKSEEIKRIAKELNYVPNQAARSLVRRRSMTIGMIIPDIENSFFSSLVKTIEDVLRQEGYSLIIVNSNDRYEQDLSLLQLLELRGIDGLLLTIGNESYQHLNDLEQFMAKYPVPYVVVDRMIPWAKTGVWFNNEHGGFLATEFLIKQGHRRIGCIAADRYSKNGMERYLGYIRALETYQIPFDEAIVMEGSYHFRDGYQAVDALLHTDITALVCANDMTAYGAMKRLREQGRKIPDDLSIVGYDNLPLSDILDVSLTSVAQDVELLGKKSVELLLSLIQHPERTQIIMLEPQLKEKNSTRCLTD